jgi:hypothetical protein
MAAIMPRIEGQEPPWYRQFWPWVLIALPAASVIASLTLVSIAVQTRDSLVRDDYYKAGRAINQELGRDRMAATLGVDAALALDQGRVNVRLGAGEQLDEPALTLSLRHPTLAERDREVLLTRIDSDLYVADLGVLPQAWWHVELTPPHRAWRLTGRWALPAEERLSLEPAVRAPE